MNCPEDTARRHYHRLIAKLATLNEKLINVKALHKETVVSLAYDVDV